MALLILAVVTILVLTDAQSIGNGTLRLVINNQSAIYYTSGIVEVYYNDTWGTICSTSTFGQTEANVVCRQQGFTGASSYSIAGQQNYGIASSNIISGVECGTVSSYLVLFQCNMNFTSDACMPSNAVTVNCLSTRIWDSPYTGQIRLQQGEYTSEGLVEIYCNGQWGTICENNFDIFAASSICYQLGYNEALSFGSLSVTGNTSQPIWLNNVTCGYRTTCLSYCKSCPSTQVSTCDHNQDTTVQCYYDKNSLQNGGVLQFYPCDYRNDNLTSTINVFAFLLGAALGYLIVSAFIFICCYAIGSLITCKVKQ